VLDLSKNLLTSVRLGIFLPRPVNHPCQLINLIVLNIAENSIQIISEQDLLPFPSLRLLNLFNNKLIEVNFTNKLINSWTIHRMDNSPKFLINLSRNFKYPLNNIFIN